MHRYVTVRASLSVSVIIYGCVAGRNANYCRAATEAFGAWDKTHGYCSSNSSDSEYEGKDERGTDDGITVGIVVPAASAKL